MKAVVAAFNQEKALVGAFSVITNLRMELFEALVTPDLVRPGRGDLPADVRDLLAPPLPELGRVVVAAADGRVRGAVQQQTGRAQVRVRSRGAGERIKVRVRASNEGSFAIYL